MWGTRANICSFFFKIGCLEICILFRAAGRRTKATTTSTRSLNPLICVSIWKVWIRKVKILWQRIAQIEAMTYMCGHWFYDSGLDQWVLLIPTPKSLYFLIPFKEVAYFAWRADRCRMMQTVGAWVQWPSLTSYMYRWLRSSNTFFPSSSSHILDTGSETRLSVCYVICMSGSSSVVLLRRQNDDFKCFNFARPGLK